MEELSKETRGLPPQLLDLIPDERDWKKVGEARDDGGRSSRAVAVFNAGAEDDKELELKLGLPGVKLEQDGESCSALSLGCFPAHSRLASTRAKRGFFDTVEAKSQGYDQRQQDRGGCGNELTLGRGESMLSGERKKGCCLPPPPSSHGSAAAGAAAAAPVHSNSPQERAAVLPVVGWPPVRSFRRNLTNGSSSKQSPERQNDEAADKAKQICKNRPLVKINMDGIPIGRKVDLAAYDSYQKLSSGVEELFSVFLEAQNDLSCAESGEQRAEEKIFSGLLDGTGEYALVYEDDDGDRMLVGDIPWSAFVTAAKRLRVMRRSELPQDVIGASSERVADC